MPNFDPGHMKTVVEAVLLVSPEPLPFSELKKLFDEEPSSETLRRVLEDLRRDWQGRGVELTHVASSAEPNVTTWLVDRCCVVSKFPFVARTRWTHASTGIPDSFS